MGLSDFKTFFSMTYFTDKAFSASWLDRSKGLSDMLVKKDDEDESIPQSQITSQTKKNNETTFDVEREVVIGGIWTDLSYTKPYVSVHMVPTIYNGYC